MNDKNKSIVVALKKFYSLYCGFGAILIALIASIVIISVIARYCFGKSWQQLQEFCTVSFALSSFWGMGLCVLSNEHIIVDTLVIKFNKKVQRSFALLGLIVTFIVVAIFTYLSFEYVVTNGRQLSYGMRIPMYYLYGIMPITSALCLVCVVIRVVLWFKNIEDPLDHRDPEDEDQGNVA